MEGDEEGMVDMVKIKMEAVEEYHRMHTGSNKGDTENEPEDDNHDSDDIMSDIVNKDHPAMAIGPFLRPVPTKHSSLAIPKKRKRTTEESKHKASKRSRAGPMQEQQLPPGLEGPCTRCVWSKKTCVTEWPKRAACEGCAQPLSADRLKHLNKDRPDKDLNKPCQPKADKGAGKNTLNRSSHKWAKTTLAMLPKQPLSAPTKPMHKRSLSVALASNASNSDEENDYVPVVTGTSKPPGPTRMILKPMPHCGTLNFPSEKTKGKCAQKSVTPGSEFETSA
jgi:hypothetical protein